MFNVARIVFFLFAALLLTGGIAGFMEKQSVPSLAAGVVCGGLSLAGALMLPTRPTLALSLGIAAAVLAAGGMIPRMIKAENKVWPSGTVVVASVVTLIVGGAALAAARGAANTPPAGVGP
jgi:Transmembrane proteins 14C.